MNPNHEDYGLLLPTTATALLLYDYYYYALHGRTCMGAVVYYILSIRILLYINMYELERAAASSAPSAISSPAACMIMHDAAHHHAMLQPSLAHQSPPAILQHQAPPPQPERARLEERADASGGSGL